MILCVCLKVLRKNCFVSVKCRKFHEKTLSEDKEFKLWEGMFHEIMNEDKGEEVVNYLIAWATKHL